MSCFSLAESILKKCMEVYDLGMVVEIQSMIQEEIEKQYNECKQKFNFLPKNIIDLSSEISFDDDFTKDTYNKLLVSGLFFVLYPQLTGDWETDKQEFCELEKNVNR